MLSVLIEQEEFLLPRGTYRQSGRAEVSSCVLDDTEWWACVFFITSILDGSFTKSDSVLLLCVTFRCILCKGQDYPPLHPRPVMMAIPLKVPVCEPETEKGKIEEAYIRNKLMHPERAEEAENVKGLMKMFAVRNHFKDYNFFINCNSICLQIACKSSRLMSALEIAKMFPNEDSVSDTDVHVNSLIIELL